MARRFTSEWFDESGQEFQIDIFDDNYTDSAVEQELRCGLPGFELSYESETDQPYQGIIASTLSVFFINEGGSFDTWLQSIPSFVGENDVTIRLQRKTSEGFKIEWAGVVMVDQVVIEDAPTPSRVQLVANDGTAQLKNVVPDIAGDAMYVNNVKDWLLSYLKETKSSLHWNTGDPFLRAWTDFKPENWGTLGSSGLNILDVASYRGVFDPNSSNVVDGELQSYNAWTMLQSVCMVFNARLCLANGEWHFWPVNQHVMWADGTDYTYLHQLYSKGGVLQSQNQAVRGEFKTRTTPQLGPGTTAGRYVQLAGGVITHTVPLKSFRRARPYRGQEWLNNTIRTGSSAAINIYDNGRGLVDFDDPRSFFTGSGFVVEGNIQVNRPAGAVAGYPANLPGEYISLRVKFNLDVGSYRFDPNNNVWDTDQSTDRYLLVSAYIGSFSGGIDTSVPFYKITTPLPADSETLALEIEADFQTLFGIDVNSVFEGNSPATQLGCALTTSINNEANQNLLIFQGESGRDNSEEFDQGNLVLGTVDSPFTQTGEIFATTSYQGVNNINWDMGTWQSSQSTTGEHINRLCVREAIALLQGGLPKREGAIKIPSGSRIPSPLMTIQNAAGGKYYMVTACTYSAWERLATVTRLELDGGLSMSGIIDNGTEGKKGDSTGKRGSGVGTGPGATDDDGTGGGADGGQPFGGLQSGVKRELDTLHQFIKVGDGGVVSVKGQNGSTFDPDDVQVFFDGASGGTKSRSGFSNNRLVMVGTDGGMEELEAGKAGQVLVSQGNTADADWLDDITAIGAASGRVSSLYPNSFYYGSSSYGWNYPIWSSITFNNTQGNPYARQISDDYAHCGIICPQDFAKVKLRGTIRNDSSTDNVRVFLGKARTPNGVSSNITLTEVGTDDVTITTQDRHYDFEVFNTGVSVDAGELLVVGFARTAGSAATRYLNFSFNLYGYR